LRITRSMCSAVPFEAREGAKLDAISAEVA
jgi:hypothetical protein